MHNLSAQVRWLTLDVGPLALGTARHPVWFGGQALPHLKRLRLIGNQVNGLSILPQNLSRSKPTVCTGSPVHASCSATADLLAPACRRRNETARSGH